jgi:hypothetical protein
MRQRCAVGYFCGLRLQKCVAAPMARVLSILTTENRRMNLRQSLVVATRPAARLATAPPGFPEPAATDRTGSPALGISLLFLMGPRMSSS